MRLVIMESPYAGRPPLAWLKRWRNVRYARAAVRDCLSRGEAPIASHLLYTQPGVLRDDVPSEREWGINAGLAWGAVAECSVQYVDEGVSSGMRFGVARAAQEGRPVETRTVPGWRRCPVLWALRGVSARGSK